MFANRPFTCRLFNLLCVVVVVVAASACGGDSSESTTGATPRPTLGQSVRPAAPQQPAQQPASQQPAQNQPVLAETLAVTPLTDELCTAVSTWANTAPTLAEQVLDNMIAGVETEDLQAASDVVAALDPAGDIGTFVQRWTTVMRHRQGFITAIGGPVDLFEVDRLLYEVELLAPVDGLDTETIAGRISAECGVVAPVNAPS